MSRYIDADILTEVLKLNGLKDSLVYMFIDQEPTVDVKPNWVSVSERLPEEDGWYLVTAPNNDGEMQVWISHFIRELFDNEWEPQEVIAWMPLPGPYKEE